MSERNVSSYEINKRRIKSCFVEYCIMTQHSGTYPYINISNTVINSIADKSGVPQNEVLAILRELNPASHFPDDIV